MAETQGITSIADGLVVAEKAQNLIPTNEEHQRHAAVGLSAEVIVTKDNDHAMSDHALSSETTQNMEDKDCLLNIEIFATNDQTRQAKQDEVMKKSDSGECRNILPILVEHLRSAIELSTINRNPLIMDEMLISGGSTAKLSPCHSNSQHTKGESIKSLRASLTKKDLVFFQDRLFADIKTALVRLQDVLCRVDVDALCRYSSSLESNDKLHLLQMISNLVTNLRMVKLENVPHSISSTATKRQNHPRGRDRHTIGVSSEELARARKWLEEREPSVNAPITLSSAPSKIRKPQSVIIPHGENPYSSATHNSQDQTFDSTRACDKHMKDAINQQQSLQSRCRDAEVSSPSIAVPDSKMTADISNTSRSAEKVDTPSILSTPPAAVIFTSKSCNKFTAKKSKIKRANTIDIPNYLKRRVESDNPSSCLGLRRPIDISDRLSWNPSQNINMAIPSFEPKTENDRKFLALINRNNGASGSDAPGGQSPFKSFNYRQTSSIADKNWKSRFSDIKTSFDKSLPLTPPLNFESWQNKLRDFNKPQNEHYSKERDKDWTGIVNTSFTLAPSAQVSLVSQHNFSPPELPIFTHAVSSPFQKIGISKKKVNHQESPLSSTSYLPACASGGMLRAKVKMFDRRKEADHLPSRVKNEHTCLNFSLDTKKVINSDANSKYTQQTHTTSNNNSIDSSFADYYSRQNTMSHDDMVRLNKREEDVQCRQSVAVQTIDHPIEVEQHVLTLDRHDSIAMLQQLGFHSKQQIHLPQQPSSSPLTIPPPPPLPAPLPIMMSTPFYSENGNLLRVPSNETNSTYKHSFQCCNLNTYLGDHNDDNNNSIDNNLISGVLTTGDDSFINQGNIENQDISTDGIVTRYTSAIVTVEKSPSPSRTFPPILLSKCSHDQSSVRPLFPRSNDVQQHNMLQQSIIRQFQHQDDAQQPLDRIMKPSRRYSTARFEQEYSTPPFNSLPAPPPSIKINDEYCGSLIGSNNTQEKINLFEEKFIGRNDCRIEKPVPPLESRIRAAIPDLSSTIDITNLSSSKSWPKFRDCPPRVCPSSSAFKYQIGPGDSSDEYLVSCASRPHRSIVLSKSESWHQLAMSKSHLQVPQHVQQQSQQKPSSKMTSYSPKRFDGTLSDELKEMEKKVQSYFHSSCNVPMTSYHKPGKSSDQDVRRSFSPRKSRGALARSHTMPHIYDEKTDIDKQFDSLFEEATHDSTN